MTAKKIKHDISYINEALRPLAVPIHEIKFDSRNARRHSRRNLDVTKASLKKNGQAKPVVIWQRGNEKVVVAGNGTLTAAIELGWTHLAANVREFASEEEARAYALDDNRSAELADWDSEILPMQLEELKGAGFDLEEHGWTDVEIEDFVNPKPTAGGKARRQKDEAKPKIPVITNIEQGQIIELGRHRLICGDSFVGETLNALLGERRVDMVCTDPPFAIYGSSSGIGSSIADDKMVLPFFRAVAVLMLERTKVWAHLYTHCDWRSWSAIWTAYREVGLAPKNMIVWDKQSSGLGSMYSMAHELVAFHAHLPKETAMKSTMKRGQRQVYQPNIFRTPRVRGEERLHNAAKPVDLEAWFIKNSTEEGETVLDPFGGSGTTLIAAEREGRVCYMVEKEAEHCKIIVERYRRFVESEGTDEGDDLAERVRESA
jgi:DNA modification methylase